MFKHERADKIMAILKKHKYTTVDCLVGELHYSPATIRRDLTYLYTLGLVEKSYGGVSIKEKAKPFIVREHENVAKKTRICQEAAKLIGDHCNVFIDGTTTTFFMHEFLEGKKGVTVATSNLRLALELGEKKIPCYVTGGRVLDTSFLVGPCAVDTINKMNFDICFFSTGAISEEGSIAMGEALAPHTRAAIERASKVACLCDSSKLNAPFLLNFMSLKDVDFFVSDAEFDADFKERFPHTEFIAAR